MDEAPRVTGVSHEMLSQSVKLAWRSTALLRRRRAKRLRIKGIDIQLGLFDRLS
jgi:hypothetical protein